MATPEQARRRVVAFITVAVLLALLLFSCSIGLLGDREDAARPSGAPAEAPSFIEQEEGDRIPELKPEQTPIAQVPVIDDVYVPVGSPVVPVESVAEEPTIVPVVPVPTPQALPPSCATDPSLCPPPPPPVDITPPGCPTGIQISDVSARSAVARWGAALDNVGVAGYTVFLDGNVMGHSRDREFVLTDLSPAQEYTVRVVAYDAAGNVSGGCGSQSFRTQRLPDLLPPTIPADTTCTTVDETTIEVTWAESSDNVRVDHYTVFAGSEPVRDPATGDVVTYANPPATVTALEPGTAYDFTVEAVDTSGNVSPASVTSSCTTLADTQVPTAPIEVSVDSITSTTAVLSWSGATDNVSIAKYLVYIDGTQVGEATTETYTATGLAPSATYSFTVVAVDDSGNQSSASAAATGITLAADTTAPSVPSGLTASSITTTGFTVAWAASTDDQDTADLLAYEVFVNGISAGAVTGVTSLDVTGRLPSTTYTVTVTAADAAGNPSAASNPLSVTTEAPTAPPLLRSPAPHTATADVSR